MKKIDLSGKWNLKLDKEKLGIEKKYYEGLDTDKTIELPGTVSQQKKSPLTEERATGFLTDPYKFEGYCWYEKSIQIPAEYFGDSEVIDCRLCLERTRYSTLWVNGKLIGENKSLIGKHYYDFQILSAEANVSITVLVSNIDYIVPGGHMTSPDTQTNWNGITGEISLEILENSRLEETRLSYSEGKLNVETVLIGEGPCECKFEIQNVFYVTKNLQPGKNQFSIELPQNIKLWSDNNPQIYDLKVILNSESSYLYKIGFRDFKAKGKFLECNGKKVFLRGKHDGMIFPETGFAPTDKESWLKVMKTARNYGINHYRFHTCCPPQAAFEAADELGIFLSPEIPFWGTIQAPGEDGFNQEQQDYLISEGFNILKNFGNHPSFVMMSMGNELWGSESRLDEIMKAYHDFDSTRLYSGGSNNFQFWPRTTEHEDYFVGVRFGKDELIRGSYAQCDAPLGFIQTDEPNTNHSYDKFFQNSLESESSDAGSQEIEIQFGTGVKKVKAEGNGNKFLPNKPCISHEVGQYCMYPNFEENQRFTGVLKPYNFEEFENRLKNAGLESRAKDFFRDSSRLAVQCYKNEIEAALRSNEISGFQLLDIQDFTGQGTAVVGVLNAFMESKGIVSGPQWSSFCSKTVLLASFEKYVWENNEELNAQIIFHNYSDEDYSDNFVTAYLIDSETDEILCEEQFDIPSNVLGNQILGNFKYEFESITEYKKYALLLILNSEDEDEDKGIVNSYVLHVYPNSDVKIVEALEQLKTNDFVEIKNAVLTKSKTIAEKESASGKKVIYFPEEFETKETVPGTYCTDFWCYPMFRSISESMNKPIPAGTLGLTIQTDDLLLEKFPTDTYTTPKWYNILTHSTCVNITDSEIEPIVQMIDNFERNWKLGILWEEKGMIVCTSRLWEISHKPEVSAFLNSLLD